MDEKKEDEAVAALAAANPPAEELKGETVATEYVPPSTPPPSPCLFPAPCQYASDQLALLLGNRSAPVTKTEETPAAAAAPEPTPAAAPAPAAIAAKPAQQKKKSIWASCCGGGDGSDLKA